MAVQLRKYTLHLNHCAWKYILCMKIFTHCGNISCVQKHLYECTKFLACMEILVSLAVETYDCANISSCAEILSLAVEIYSSNLCAVWKYFQVPANVLFVCRNYYVPCADFGLPTILGMLSCHD